MPAGCPRCGRRHWYLWGDMVGQGHSCKGSFRPSFRPQSRGYRPPCPPVQGCPTLRGAASDLPFPLPQQVCFHCLILKPDTDSVQLGSRPRLSSEPHQGSLHPRPVAPGLHRAEAAFKQHLYLAYTHREEHAARWHWHPIPCLCRHH